MKIIIDLIIFLVITIISLEIVIFIIRLVTGVSKEQALDMVHGFFTQTEPYHIFSDGWLIYELNEIILNVIGETRYDELVKLTNNQVIINGYGSGLPYIGIVIFFQDDNEKMRIQHIIVNKIKQYLEIHGLCIDVVVDWKFNNDLKVPVLMIRFAESEEENIVLKRTIKTQKRQIINKHMPLEDDELEL